MDEKTRPSLHNVAVGEQVRPMAALDDEQVERIAVRVVALLAEKLTNAG